jgi:hypothetical protein
MAQPAPNHINIDAGFEQTYSTRMSKYVRADMVTFRAGL